MPLHMLIYSLARKHLRASAIPAPLTISRLSRFSFRRAYETPRAQVATYDLVGHCISNVVTAEVAVAGQLMLISDLRDFDRQEQKLARANGANDAILRSPSSQFTYWHPNISTRAIFAGTSNAITHTPIPIDSGMLVRGRSTLQACHQEQA